MAAAPPNVQKQSITTFTDPPEKMEISENRLTLREGDSAQGRILCTADAHPEADFTWVRMEEGEEDSTGGEDGEDEDSTSVADGNVLFFDGGGVTRDQVGVDSTSFVQ